MVFISGQSIESYLSKEAGSIDKRLFIWYFLGGSLDDKDENQLKGFRTPIGHTAALAFYISAKGKRTAPTILKNWHKQLEWITGIREGPVYERIRHNHSALIGLILGIKEEGNSRAKDWLDELLQSKLQGDAQEQRWARLLLCLWGKPEHLDPKSRDYLLIARLQSPNREPIQDELQWLTDLRHQDFPYDEEDFEWNVLLIAYTDHLIRKAGLAMPEYYEYLQLEERCKWLQQIEKGINQQARKRANWLGTLRYLFFQILFLGTTYLVSQSGVGWGITLLTSLPWIALLMDTYLFKWLRRQQSTSLLDRRTKIYQKTRRKFFRRYGIDPEEKNKLLRRMAQIREMEHLRKLPLSPC